MINKLFFFFTNNRFVNSILIFLKLDRWMTDKFGIYKRIRINKKLSPQEMAGFSNVPHINEAINKTHTQLIYFINERLRKNDEILDIGCGAGAYLKNFNEDYFCTGIDVNKDMIERGKKDLPNVNFILGSFLDQHFSKKFHAIYCISVLEFIPPSQLDLFFKKVSDYLEEGGFLFLHYPPALKKSDLYYPDLYYIEYAPKVVENAASNYLQIVKHEQAFNGRKFSEYDPKPYGKGERIFTNAYLMIAKK